MRQTMLLLVLVALSLRARAQVPVIPPIEVTPLTLSEQAERDYAKRRAEMARIFEKREKGISLTAQEQQTASEYDELAPEYGKILGDGCSWYCGNGYPTKIVASSTLKSQGSYSYNPDHAHDNDYRSVWCEGVEGYGIGEYIEYTFAADCPRITRIIIAGGHVKSPTAWKNNSRPKQLKLYVNGSPLAILDLKDERAEQTFEFEPIGRMGDKPWTMRFEIVDVYKGDRWDDVVISEIYFDGIDVHCLAKGTPVRMGDGTERAIEQIEVGDWVAYYDHGSRALSQARVEGVAKKAHGAVVTYEFSSGKRITATKSHPFYVKGKGWASLNPYETMMCTDFPNVERIGEGDVFVTADGEDMLVRQLVRKEKTQTYTITKTSEGDNFVANGFVVGVERGE